MGLIYFLLMLIILLLLALYLQARRHKESIQDAIRNDAGGTRVWVSNEISALRAKLKA